jgi:hypothetical protein
MFNWAAMAEGALGQHWRERTPDERAEFVRVFTAVFERAYLSKIQLADAERFAYSIIARSSYPELVNRLKALREQHGGISSATTRRPT